MKRGLIFPVLLLIPQLDAQLLRDLAPPPHAASGGTLIVGFLGGFEPWNDSHRGVRRLALQLREATGVYAETFSNHNRGTALAWLVRALDADGDGTLDALERDAARIVLYGQSWGAGPRDSRQRPRRREFLPTRCIHHQRAVEN